MNDGVNIQVKVDKETIENMNRILRSIDPNISFDKPSDLLRYALMCILHTELEDAGHGELVVAASDNTRFAEYVQNAHNWWFQGEKKKEGVTI